MHSRSHILINRELKKIHLLQPWGIKVTIRNSIFKWDVAMNGLKDSIWKDCELNLAVEFTEHFNEISPDIYFQTIPFHPNIDPVSGRPCSDCLGDNWKSCMNLESVFISIQCLLSEPQTNNGNVLNSEAAQLYNHNRLHYDQIVLKCIQATKPQSTPSVVHVATKERLKTTCNQKISFEEYHSAWRNLATSSVRSQQFVDTESNDEKMFCVSDSQVKEEEEEDKQHTANTVKRDSKIQNKINKINKMKNIYLEARNSPRKIKRDDEISELIQWTEGLNEDDI